MYQFEQFSFSGNTDLTLMECGVHDVPAGYFMSENFIRRHDILHFIRRGKGILRLSNIEYQLGQGDCFYIPAYTPSFYQADAADPWSYSWIIIDGVKAHRIIQALKLSLRSPIIRISRPDVVWDEIHRLLTCKDGPEREALLLGHTYLILHRTVQDNQDREAQRGPDYRLDQYVHTAIQFIRANYAKPLQIADIARHVGLTPNYFGVIFRQYIGVAPQIYLLKLRMQTAMALLSTTSRPIREVAANVGYENPVSFTKSFHKYLGVSPRQYRADPRQLDHLLTTVDSINIIKGDIGHGSPV